ncbi:hypothetical protein [Tenggerimyces flavus]|uniref:Uncharacterized protein n=1 Tax=Tenggerimyces flavus TaxID=1708749 RepID=A0ABV7YC11_9ACTN|nr:hypothetical protein [Tenggerimyces flavus]MBM7789022.1 hypothetical protein [Tenggerimyces flavus]
MEVARLVRKLLGRPEPLSRRDRLDAMDAVGGAECAVCRAMNDEVKRWFFMYENETRADFELRERLDRSLGFCAAHTRHLLDSGPATSWLARWLFSEVARAAVLAVAEGAQYGDFEPCPACLAVQRTEHDLLGLLANALHDPDVARLFESGDAVCVRHGVALLRRRVKSVAGLLAERLGKDTATAERHLIGVDLDYSRRRKLRQRHVDDVLGADDADWLLDAPCCPLCAEADRTAWRQLGWLATLPRDEAADLRAEATLCANHLADLIGVRDPAGADVLTDDGLLPAVAAVIDHNAALWQADFAGANPATAGRKLDCHVCLLQSQAVERERGRLAGASPSRVANAHGVCVRHGVGLARDLPEPWRDRLAQRIGALSAELDESRRKAGWDARAEVKGEEMRAWSRAPFLLDGAILGPRSPEHPPGAEA